METETIASRNVVELLLGDVFDLPGLCPATEECETEPCAEKSTVPTFIYGWDCL
jgi:hypothetical protein